MDKIEIPELAPIDQVDSESLELGSPEEKLETATKDESPLQEDELTRLTPELQSQQTNLQYEQQSDSEESSVASETESTLETTSLVKEAEISESADSKSFDRRFGNITIRTGSQIS